MNISQFLANNIIDIIAAVIALIAMIFWRVPKSPDKMAEKSV